MLVGFIKISLNGWGRTILIEADGFDYDTSSEDETEQDQGADFEKFNITGSDPEEENFGGFRRYKNVSTKAGRCRT